MLSTLRSFRQPIVAAVGIVLLFAIAARAQDVGGISPGSNIPIGPKATAQSVPIAPATDAAPFPFSASDGGIASLGTKADTPYTGTGSATDIAILKGIFAGLANKDLAGNLKASETGSSDPAVGILPNATQSGTSAVGKASAGNLYSAYATNLTGNSGFLAIINATAVPAAGATITPQDCLPIYANSNVVLNYNAGPPDVYTTGVVVLLTTSCSTYTTTSGPSGFIKTRVR